MQKWSEAGNDELKDSQEHQVALNRIKSCALFNQNCHIIHSLNLSSHINMSPPSGIAGDGRQAPLRPSERGKPTPVTNSIPGHGTYPEPTTELTKTVQLWG